MVSLKYSLLITVALAIYIGILGSVDHRISGARQPNESLLTYFLTVFSNAIYFIPLFGIWLFAAYKIRKKALAS
jgi:hypothetical protein